MAITIVQTPAAHAALTDPLIHQVSSSNVVEPDFRYIFDIYIGGTLVFRGRVLPDLNGTLDVSRIVRNYAQLFFAPSVIAPPAAQEYTPSVQYTVQYGEEYRVGSVTTQYLNLANSTHEAWNTYGPLFPIEDNDQPLANKLETFVTDRDLEDIHIGDGPAFLTFYGPGTWGISLDILDADGVPDGSNWTTITPITISETHQVIDISRDSMNNADWGGATPIPANAAGYRFALNGASISTPYVYVFFDCGGLPVHFLNRYGGFDTFFFTGVNRRDMTVERQHYRTSGLQVVSGALREYDGTRALYAEHTRQHATRFTGGWKLRSGWLSDTEQEWLTQLLVSPMVYVTYNGSYLPVTVASSDWAERMTRFDKVFDLEMDLRLQRDGRAQFR